VPGVNRWWQNDPAEIYLLETTDRADIGVDLKAPQADDAGHAHHAYALVPHARPGDIVFHYQKPVGIVGWSRVVGVPFEDDITWGARGRVAQRAGVKPYLRPGWRVPLEGPFMLSNPISLGDLRTHEQAIRTATESAEAEIPGTLYRPFQLSDLQPLRPTQHYLTKLPLGVVLAVPALLTAADQAGNRATDALASPPEKPVAPAMPSGLGQAYVKADEDAASTERDPFTIDPATVDRGVRGHATTQNALSQAVTLAGHAPRSPSANEPQYDLAWTSGSTVFVTEVKSLTDTNEERQLRLGLGQVLRYRHLMSAAGLHVTPVLATERPPRDDSWIVLCRSLGVVLTWPTMFPGLFQYREH